MDYGLLVISVIAVAVIAGWTRSRERSEGDRYREDQGGENSVEQAVEDAPPSDSICDQFYARFEDGYHETVKLKIFELSDRMVIRSILHAEGIPTAEWHGHAARNLVGSANLGSVVTTLLLLEEDVPDAVRIISNYWVSKYKIRDFQSKVQFLGFDIAGILAFVSGDGGPRYPPEISPLDPK